MKKLLCMVMTFLIINTVTAFAGSIPEDVLHYDEAQVFFAKLATYKAEEADEENEEDRYTANLIPTKVIKGDVEEGANLWYSDVVKVGDFTASMGDEYLFLYYDEYNATYFFKTTTRETKTLKLENTSGDMWDRLEKYLNNGEFEKAEQERVENSKVKTVTQLLATEKSKINNIVVVYRSEAETKEIEVDRKQLIELLDSISCEQITPDTSSETEGFFIRIIDKIGRKREIFISKSGLVSKNKIDSSIVESAKYKMGHTDLERLYEQAGVEMPKNDNIGPYIILAVIVAMMIACVFIFIRNQNQ